ncbi:protein SRC2 homolog [Oryza brachyantha]|uniref:C2 domain-containing protein n=1 Tax=Oryza brachyantha TaxID=4533 RepID=J3MVD2_ORYBR|nr:protein SRC2 homolog [Oryza brachyantha]
MGSRYEVEVTVSSARDLKNVNWRNGDLNPYAVLWIDDGARCSTRVDLDNGDNPDWDDKLTLPLPPSSRLDDAVLYIDVVHANAADGVKPLVGSARLPLRDVLDDAGIGARVSRSLRLKRPSGRPQGRLELRLAVRYYDTPPANYPAPYGQPAGFRDPYAYASGGQGQQYPYEYTAPPAAGYPSSAAYGGPVVVEEEKKKSKMGMGTGLAVGAAAGVLGGLALAGGASYLEDKFEEGVADDLARDRDDDDDDYNDDF